MPIVSIVSFIAADERLKVVIFRDDNHSVVQRVR
jgi:hypothetical protein